jgi:MFS transporter, AAHS family, 4-hydroxybenzoate transporter
VGWGLGIGRTGAIVGPYLGGMLLGLNWGPRELFLAAAVPALVSTITMVAMMFAMKLPTTAATQRPAPVAH